jgi:regulator of protease activity HflC (stomatin/prohibitin superfamily)
MHPGINIVVPYLDRVGTKVNIQEQIIHIPEMHVITSDNVMVDVDGHVYIRVIEPEKAAYSVGNFLQSIATLAITNIRAVMGDMELDATLSSRDKINSQVLNILDHATSAWGTKVIRVEISKIEPPKMLIEAMNMQMTAERERRAVVLRADGEREAQVLAAEGRKDAAMRDAQARVELANAEATAIKVVSEASSRYGQAALQYFATDRYVRAIEAMASAPNTRLVVIPMEAAALAGGIIQGLEILRSSKGEVQPESATKESSGLSTTSVAAPILKPVVHA